MQTDLIRPQEAANLLGISRRKMYYMIEDGEVKSIKLGPQSTRVYRSEILKLLEGPKE